MRELSNHLIGVDQGDRVLFSDFEDDGEMWTGQGQRERRLYTPFSAPFRSIPVVHVSLSLWDVDTETPLRAVVLADSITKNGFDIVFRTWGDTRVARVSVAWLAFGELPQEDDWNIY